MQEYSLVSPRGTPHTLRVEVGNRIALALPGRTVAYIGRLDALRLAHDLLKILEPNLTQPDDGGQTPQAEPVDPMHSTTGMGYLRQHRERGRVRAVALVVQEPKGFFVRLTENDLPARRSHEGLHYYASRDIAFAAADALARHWLGGHECHAGCTGWLEPVH
jgi:hypothetical protein